MYKSSSLDNNRRMKECAVFTCCWFPSCGRWCGWRGATAPTGCATWADWTRSTSSSTREWRFWCRCRATASPPRKSTPFSPRTARYFFKRKQESELLWSVAPLINRRVIRARQAQVVWLRSTKVVFQVLGNLKIRFKRIKCIKALERQPH